MDSSHNSTLSSHGDFIPPLFLDSSDYDNVTNGTSEQNINSFYFYETEQFVMLWLLFAFIVLGNSAVLSALLLDRARAKSRMNFFIMHLAIADLSVGLINVLTDIVWRITVAWYAGNVACKLIRFLQVLVTYSSTYVLVALSIDRYDAITHPMNFSGSWRRARALVAAAWTLSAVFSAPMLFLYEERVVQGQPQCWIDLPEPWHWQLYMTLVAVVLFAIPAVIISFCYSVIVATIWAQGRILGAAPHSKSQQARLKQTNKQNGHGVGGGGNASTEDEADSRRASSRGLIPRAKIKTVKMTLVIVCVFVMCWSPYIIFDLLQVYGQVPVTQTTTAVATFIQSLAPLNSAANPIIYCLFSSSICRSLRRVPPLAWLRRGRGDDHHHQGGGGHGRGHRGGYHSSTSAGWRVGGAGGRGSGPESTSLSELATTSTSGSSRGTVKLQAPLKQDVFASQPML